MKTIYIFLITCVFLLAEFTPSTAQRTTEMPQSRRKSMFGRELFNYRYYSFADTTDRNLTRVRFHFAIINDLLSFIRTDDGKYKARYEISVMIYDKDKNAIAEQSVSDRILEDEYTATNDRNYPHLHSLTINLKSGFYNALIRLVDLESDQVIDREEELHIRKLDADKLNMSDPVFVDELTCSEEKTVYTPNLRNVFQDIKSAFASYIEFYPPANTDTLKVDYTLKNKDKVIFSELRTFQVTQKKLLADTLSFRSHLKKPDEYTLYITAKANGQTEKISRVFQVFWGSMPLKTENLSFAVEQLALVANKSTIDSLREATEDEKEKLFDTFWEKRDPTPNTARNELKEEFFRRVDFANQNFTEISSGRTGWLSDRGRVFIKYGPPDTVDRREVEVNVPASEVWTYSKENRRYYFVDRNNDGVYRLVKIE